MADWLVRIAHERLTADEREALWATNDAIDDSTPLTPPDEAIFEKTT